METATVDIPTGLPLTEEPAKVIFAKGEAAVVYALLELTKRLAEAEAKQNPSTTPSTLSGMVPVYEKPPAKKRKKSPGGKRGHAGSRRQKPERIDHQQDHRADHCPDCETPLKRCAETRTRYIEEIPEVHPEVTDF